MASFLDRHGGYCTCTRDKCTDDCATYRRFKPKHMTNADRIRSMNNEELANFMFEYGGSAPNCRENKLNHNCTSCNVCWFDWMKKTEGNK